MKSKSPNIAIRLKNVTKRYTLHHEKPTFSEQLLLNRKKKEVFTALDKVDITIKKGEKVGIIGSNGSGKTTILKIIAGITSPTLGSVQTIGKVVSLIDLEAGFHPDLTGEENIFLNGMVVGMSKAEINEKFQSIIDFAEIGSFIDAPLYTYSAGMKLRLGFAVAIHADPDILILDEGISAGDFNFQKKIAEKIEGFFAAGRTIVLVTHILDDVEKRCPRTIWIEKGRKKADGVTKKVLDMYRHHR